jgi:predicted MFS family arabinose efflux permease
VSSIPAGQALFVPVAAAMIPALGWRATYIVTGAVLAAATLPILWWLAPDPPLKRHERHPVGRASVRAKADVWLIGAGYFACGFSDQFVAFHMVTLVSEAGVNPVKAAGFLSFALFAGVIGSIISGPLADRSSPRNILAALYFARAATLPLLLLVAPTREWNLAIFGLVFGLTYISNQAPSTRLVRDRYGVNAVGALMGNIGLVHQFGAGAGIATGGLSVRLTGHYAVAIVATAAVAFAGGVLQMMIRESATGAGAGARTD